MWLSYPSLLKMTQCAFSQKIQFHQKMKVPEQYMNFFFCLFVKLLEIKVVLKTREKSYTDTGVIHLLRYRWGEGGWVKFVMLC